MTFHVANLSDRIFAKHLVGSHAPRLESQLMIDQRKDAGLFCHLGHLACFFRVHRHRLFTKDVFTVLDGGHRHLMMELRWCGDADEIDIITSDSLTPVVGKVCDGALVEDATGLVSVSMSEYPKYKHRVEFYGTDGALAVEARGELFFANPVPDTEWQEVGVDFGDPIAGVPDTGFSSGFTEFAPKIIDALLRGETVVENAATFEDGLAIQRVLDAARESNATHCRVEC